MNIEKCEVCKAEGFTQEEIIRDLMIPSGMPESEVIVLYGEGHRMGKNNIGNLIISMNLKKTSFF